MAKTDDSTKAQNACTMRRLPSQVACRKATRPEIFTEVGGGAVCSESCKHGSAGGQGFLRDRLPYPVAKRKGHTYGTIVSNSRSEVCVNYAGLIKRRNDTLVTACEDQSRRRLNQFYAPCGQARTPQCSEPLVFYT